MVVLVLQNHSPNEIFLLLVQVEVEVPRLASELDVAVVQVLHLLQLHGFLLDPGDLRALPHLRVRQVRRQELLVVGVLLSERTGRRH